MDNELLKAATENFNLPHDVVKLPSGGIFYKNKKTSVKVGYLTANDENIIINALQNDSGSLIYSLIKNKMYEHDIRPEDLINSDIEAILLFLRNTSFGSEYSLKLKDPKTDRDFTVNILLDELFIKKGLETPNEDGTFTVKLPKSGNIVKIRPLTYGDEREIDSMKNQYPVGRVVPVVNWRLNKQIVEVDGNPDREMISKFIDQLPISDSKFIRKYLNDNIPSLDLTKKVYTPSGEEVIVDINFGVEFFRPFF
jgi:hypothetical protein